MTWRWLYFLAIAIPVMVGTTLLLKAQFLSKYAADIEGKGLSDAVLSELSRLAVVQFIPMALIPALLIGGAAAWWLAAKRLRVQRSSLMNYLAIDMMLIAGLAFFAYRFNDRVVPEADLQLRNLLYDITITAPGAPLERTDPALFLSYGTGNSSTLSTTIDSVAQTLQQRREMVLHQLEKFPTPLVENAYQEFAEELATYGIAKGDLLSSDSTFVFENDQHRESMQRSANGLLRSGLTVLEVQQQSLMGLQTELGQRKAFAFEVALLLLTGIFIGLFFRKLPLFVPIITAAVIAVGYIYYTTSMEMMLRMSDVVPFMKAWHGVLLLMLCTLLFMMAARKNLSN